MVSVLCKKLNAFIQYVGTYFLFGIINTSTCSYQGQKTGMSRSSLWWFYLAVKINHIEQQFIIMSSKVKRVLHNITYTTNETKIYYF